MLPRRHILDVCEFVKNEKERVSMSTVTLAVDAIKFMDKGLKEDHLVGVLELNEFICYMYPAARPKNHALLFHVVSDLLGLLMYGVPKKSKKALGNIEVINYSASDIDAYPMPGVWDYLKENVYTKKHGGKSIIEGFIKKIRIEIDAMENHPFVEDIFNKSKEHIEEWIPCLSSFYERSPEKIRDAYDQWWNMWQNKGDVKKALSDMVHRLSSQAQAEYKVALDEQTIFHSIYSDKCSNQEESEKFTRWYKEGVNLLLKI